MRGEVVRLDRSLPLVETEKGQRIRCEHATNLKKGGHTRATIGDIVEVEMPEGHDVGVITRISPRRTAFVRRDPTERTMAQVLAANFDRVIIVQPANALNLKRLERELVLAHETEAEVAVILTKADLVDGREAVEGAIAQVEALAGRSVTVLAMARNDEDAIARVRELVGEGTSVLIGRSGVGKSTLVNILIGENARATSEVRARDGKGRHKTVSREIMQLPEVPGGGQAASEAPAPATPATAGETDKGMPEHKHRRAGRIIDMPGVRGLGLWEASAGLGNAFEDVETLASHCRFRDCRHTSEPGCAVRAAVESGTLSQERLTSYLNLQSELAETRRRRTQATWKNK